MKKPAIILLIAIISLTIDKLSASHGTTTLQGRVVNASQKQVFISYYDSLDKHVTDTTQLTNDGEFMFTIDRLNKMQKLFIRFSPNLYTYVFMAPGYHLNFTADLGNGTIFNRSKKVDGNGAKGNLFRFKQDSIVNEDNDSLYAKNEADFLSLLQLHQQRLASTIIEQDQINPTDTALRFIMAVNRIDLQFFKMQYLIEYLNRHTQFNADKRISFLKENTAPTIYNNLYDSTYLNSDVYNRIMKSGAYVKYLLMLDTTNDFEKLGTDEKRLKGIMLMRKNYKGKIAETALNSYMESTIERLNSYEKLQSYKTQFEELYVNQNNKNIITAVIALKDRELFLKQKGMPPVPFTLKDTGNRKFNLAAVKGKIVYIDLWASWCIPCREETPFIKALQNHYQDRKDFAILSIAVLDKQENWRMAMKEDKPTWPQFFDYNNEAKKAFLPDNGYSIPRFILLDKNGNIIDFDAPRPSDPKLKTLIDSNLL